MHNFVIFTSIFLVCTILPYMGGFLRVVRVLSYAIFCKFPVNEAIKDAVVNSGEEIGVS